MKLGSPLELNDDVQPACLPSSPGYLSLESTKDRCFTSGWGKTQYGRHFCFKYCNVARSNMSHSVTFWVYKQNQNDHFLDRITHIYSVDSQSGSGVIIVPCGLIILRGLFSASEDYYHPRSQLTVHIEEGLLVTLKKLK